MWLRLPAVLKLAVTALLAACAAAAATRPHYGGTLRVEIREPIETADPPQSGPTLGQLGAAFQITRWEPGKRAQYTTDENTPAGRAFLDTVEIEMGRPTRDQAVDLELGRADLIELAPADARRMPPNRKAWTSLPVRLVAMIFGPRIDDARIREALALSVDREAIHNVLLQRQGEVSGGLLPQWLSGIAFLFVHPPDLARARSLAADAPAASRAITLGVENPVLRPIAERIALNARDAGLSVSVVTRAGADVRLVESRIASAQPASALTAVAASLGLGDVPAADTTEALYAAERSLLEGFRVIPLFHLPDVYGTAPRVKGGPLATPLGEWRLENLWLEGGRP